MIPASFTCGGIAKDISRELMLTTGLVQQPVQIVASHDLTLFTGTSQIVKHWFSVFFLDKRYSCFGMN